MHDQVRVGEMGEVVRADPSPAFLRIPSGLRHVGLLRKTQVTRQTGGSRKSTV